MDWLKNRLTAQLDNILGAAIVGAASLVIVWLLSLYSANPQITLLWVLIVLGIADSLLLLLMYFRVTGSRRQRVHTRHRSATQDHFDRAFESGTEVFWLTIMSLHTLREMETRLTKAQATRTRVNLLTLDPALDPGVIGAVQLHLNEPPYDVNATARQIREAWEQWSALAKKYPDPIRVRTYKSIPTMQGILVRDKYIAVELIPYDTQTGDRPGLLLTRNEDPELFNLFQQKFISLWDSQHQA